MAGDWLKIEVCTPDKAEVFSIAEQLEMDPDAVIGKLIRVWGWFDQHTEKGNDASVTTSLIDRVADRSGFADGMLAVGWLRRGPHGLELPNFDRHNGKTAKARALTAKRVAKHKGNAEVTLESLPREEKRRSNTPLPPSGAFLRFWSAWPKHQRKQAKGECWKRWSKQGLDQVSSAILAHVDSLKASSDWQRGYVPAPLVYLNQRRWEGAADAAERGELKLAV